MYEAVRERAPASPHLAGASATVLALTLAGYALTSGLAMKVMKIVAPPVTLITVADPPPEPRTTLERRFDSDADPLPIPAPPAPERTFVPEDEGGTIIVKTGTADTDATRSTANTSSPPMVRIRPALLTKDKPDYPVQSIRGHEEGVTGLEVCVDAHGRVTSADIVSTSGHKRLDDAALKWVRTARFKPGTVDRVPQTVCGHGVDYEWKIMPPR
jgi:periplasmic protein TonB